MKLGLISIIIPIYNRGNLISETLDSILNQTYAHWECIIIDDGSTDNTTDVVKEYLLKDSRFTYHKRPLSMKKGANACRNYGFDLSNGAYINWFDSDDLMLPNKLEFQLNTLKNSKLSFIVCQTLVFEDNKENVLGLRKENIYSSDFFNDFVTNQIKWLTQAPLFKRSFLEENKLRFDEDLMQSQERDFFIRVLNLVDDYLFDNTPLVLFRKHVNSISHGNITRLKLNSNFMVNYNVMKNYESRLSVKSKLLLKKALKTTLKICLREKEFKLARKFKVLINSKAVGLAFYEKLKLALGSLLLKEIGKGDAFFK